MFPDWDSILNYRGVILLACGLTAENKCILEFVYDTFQQNFLESDGKETRYFLSSLCKEVSQDVEINPFCNKYINYAAVFRGSDFISSKFYVFHSGYGQYLPTRQDIKRNGLRDISTAQCAIMFVRLMTVLGCIKQLQKVSIHALHLKNVEIRQKRMKKNGQPCSSNEAAELFLHTINFGAKTKSIEIWGCRLSRSTFSKRA